MAILDYSTKIKASKTVMEIIDFITEHGGDRIAMNYKTIGGKKVPVSILFEANFRGVMCGYTLNCNFDGVLKKLKEEKIANSFKTETQAINTGWRILYHWVKAQISLVEAGMVDFGEAFVANIVVNGGSLIDAALHESRLLIK